MTIQQIQPTWQEMTEGLEANLLRHMKDGYTDEELRYCRRICPEFCRNLRDWRLSADYLPELDMRAVESVRFHVMGLPLETLPGDETSRRAETRKMTADWGETTSLAVVIGSGGLDMETSLCAALGQEAAAEVQRELKADARNGSPVRVYAIYLPPHVGRMTPDPSQFSIRRGLRICYAKVY